MNYFLYQPPRLNDADVMYCNSEPVNDSHKRIEVYDEIAKLYNGVSSKAYPWFGKNKGYFVLKGMFDAKDENGRTMSFFFASNDEDYTNKLLCITKKIGYDISLSTQKLMTDFLKKNKRNKFIKYGLVILVLILLLLTIYCLMNNA